MEQLTADERRLLSEYRRLEPTWRATIRTAAEQAVRLQRPALEPRSAPGLRLVVRNDGRQP